MECGKYGVGHMKGKHTQGWIHSVCRKYRVGYMSGKDMHMNTYVLYVRTRCGMYRS
jgi:hypothetical protein